MRDLLKTLFLPLALGRLGSARMAVPAVVYSLLMFTSGAFMIVRYGLRGTAASAEAGGAEGPFSGRTP